MDDDKEHTAEILVFRNSSGAPVAVPEGVVLEAERPYRAFKYHQQGYEWNKVAEIEGYPSAQAARADVTRYLREGAALVSDFSRRELLSLEIARLNALQAAIWPGAMRGHLPTVVVARDLIMSRAKLLKLDESIDGEEETTGPRTVIVPHDDQGYSEVLTSVIEAD